jgi:hypothetical protein
MVWGFNKIKERTGRLIETVEVSLPAVRTNTDAVWFDVDGQTKVF